MILAIRSNKIFSCSLFDLYSFLYFSIFSSLLAKPSSNAVITLAVIVSLLGLSILILSAIFLLRNFRLIPKLRARLVENTPYEDIIIPDQQNGPNSNPNYEVMGLGFAISMQLNLAFP